MSALRPSKPEPPKEYTDASGKLKFNKVDPTVAGGKRKEGIGNIEKKKAKRGKVAKLNNTKLLSFEDDDDG